jgi:hypothetical protein
MAAPGAEPVPAGTPGRRGPGGAPGFDAGGSPERVTCRMQVGVLFTNLVEAVRRGDDDDTVEAAVLALSRRSRWLVPLALSVGGFATLFQGVKTLFTNWRLTIVQILSAMWIWMAMLDLKVHVFHGSGFHQWKSPVVATAVILVIAAITTAGFS